MKCFHFYICCELLKNCVKIGRPFLMTYSFVSKKFSHKLLQCVNNQVHVLEGAQSFQINQHHFYRKLRQQLNPLDRLDNQLDGGRSVGRATTSRWSRSASSAGIVWVVIETELLSELLVKVAMVPMEASSTLKHLHLIFCTLKWLVQELFRWKST